MSFRDGIAPLEGLADCVNRGCLPLGRVVVLGHVEVGVAITPSLTHRV